MSIRLFPDFVVAVGVRESIKLKSFMAGRKMNDEVNAEEMNDILSRVLISPSGCAERQLQYKDNGISNVFLGYGEMTWSKDDYIAYMMNHPEKFIRNESDPDYFRLNVEDSGENYSGKRNISDITKKVCVSLMTEGVYGPRLMKKYGFV